MVTLAVHKRMQKYLFGNGERSILECEQRGVITSQWCKEAVIENVASNLVKKREKKDVVELYYDFQKAYDNVNHAFLEKLLKEYGFTIGTQSLIISMGPLQFRKVTIPQLLVSILYLFFGSRRFSIFCL